MTNNDLENGDQESPKVMRPSTPHYFSIPVSVIHEQPRNVTNSPRTLDSGDNNTDQSPPTHHVSHLDQPSYGSIDIKKSTRRQSIFDQPIGSFKGPNSLSRFASSFQRANSFRSIEVQHDKERSYFKDGTDEVFDPETLAPSAHGRRLSMILNNAQQQYGRDIGSPRMTLNKPLSINDILSNQPVFDDADSNISVAVSNSSSSYPTNSISQEVQSIILKKFEAEDGTTVVTLAGQSTAPQTIFNSINVLIGIGLLALPMGLSYAGWYLGIAMLFIFAGATFCTAELLSRCLSTDPTLISYGDLGYAAFGPRGRALVSLLFTLDLVGAGVALFILFGDSLNALFPSRSVTFYKICGFFIICPQSFLPLHILSHVSFLGIMSTCGTVGLVLLCGLYKVSSPGSLLEPMSTNVWPESFSNFCLSIGLLSACWGGHAIFPNLRSDMRHPEKFKDCLKTTYLITSLTDIGTAVLGFLMFGNNVLDEVTKSVLLTPGYPSIIYVLISGLMSIIPIAKTPLNAMPIVSIMDTIMEIDKSSDRGNNTASDEEDLLLASKKSSSFTNIDTTSFFKGTARLMNKVIVNFVFLITSIYFPEFDKLLAFVGALLCFLICFILPCLFYMIICRATIKKWELFTCYFVILVSVILSTLGVSAAIMS